MAILNYQDYDYEGNPLIYDNGGTPAGDIPPPPAPTTTTPDDPIEPDPAPKVGDQRMGPNGVWETWNGTSWVPNTTAPPPPPNNTPGTPRIGDRRDVPGGRYIEEWNGTTWVRYDRPGSGRDGGDTTNGTLTGAGGMGGSPAFQGQYNFPSLSLDRASYPEYQIGPAYEPGPAFDRGNPFAAPDPASIKNDPSYQWRYNEGLATQKRHGANSGTFFGGATMKALQGWGQNYASNEYKDIYSRAADVYDRNLSGKFNEWKTNEDTRYRNWEANDRQRFGGWNANRGLAFDTVNTNNAAKTNEFAPQQRWAELTFGRDFDLYKYMNDDAFRYSDLDARIKMAQAAAGRDTP